MTQHIADKLLSEAEFIERYTQYYRRQFKQAMQTPDVGPAGAAAIRMCLEALNMMHGSKQTLIEALLLTGKPMTASKAA